MSFGYGVGDFIATLKLADNLKKRFTQAPSEFKAISGEIKSLWAVLHDLSDIPREGISVQQQSEMETIVQKGHEVLLEIEDKLSKHNVLAYTTPNWKTKALRAWSRINWDPAEVNSLRSRITSCISLFNLVMGKINQEMTAEIRGDVHSIKDNHDIQLHNETLSWICPTDPSEQQRKHRNTRREGAGRWLLESEQFNQWLNSEKRSTFLCHGAPGAGKTVLASIAIDHLDKIFANDINVGVTYLYFDFRQQLELSDIFSSILRQLLQGNSGLESCISDLCSRRQNKPGRLTESEVQGQLELAVHRLGKVYFVIDALDECLDVRIRRQFLVWVKNLAPKSLTDIKVLATSRHNEQYFTGYVGNDLTLEVKASREDMENYLDANLEYLPGFIQRKPDFWLYVRNQIIASSGELFLLIRLYLNLLFDEKNEKRVRTLVTQLQSGSGAYDHAYGETMKRIKQQSPFSQDLAKRVLGWVTFSARPLTAVELQEAIAVEIGEPSFDETNITDIEDMISVCSGLVTIEESSNIARLVHFTTEEYLKRTQDSWFPDVHYYLTDTCLTYLSFDCFDDTGSTQEDPQIQREKYPFYQYSAHEIGTHLRQRLGANSLIIPFITNNAKVSRCMREIFGLSGTDCSFTGLHFATLFGLEHIIGRLPPDKNNINAWDYLGRTPLTWAAGSGNETVVKLLLERGSDPNSATKEGCTPLFYAAAYGHAEVVKLLIDAGADVNFQNQTHDTPIFFAAKGRCELRLGHTLLFDMGDHTSVLNRLLDSGATLEHKNDAGITPMHTAVQNGNKEAVELFIKRDASTKRPHPASNPMELAIQRGYFQIADSLRESSNDTPEQTSDEGSLPLETFFVQPPFSRSNVGQGASSALTPPEEFGNFSPQDEFKRLPLHWAASRGDNDLMQRILKAGSDPNPKDIFSRTPLYAAVCMGRLREVELLLNHPNIDVEVEDKLGLTPLQEAQKRQESCNRNIHWLFASHARSILGIWETISNLLKAKMGLGTERLSDVNVHYSSEKRSSPNVGLLFSPKDGFAPLPQQPFSVHCDVCLEKLNHNPKHCMDCNRVAKKNGAAWSTVKYCASCIQGIESCPLCGKPLD